MFWLRFSGWLFVLLVVATAAVLFLGSRLPADHTEAMTVVIRASPARLWPLLSEADMQSRWRSDVSSVEPAPDDNGLPCWLERHDRQPVSVCVAESTAPRRLMLRTADTRLPFRVSRSFVLTPDSNSSSRTRLFIADTVTIGPPMLRFYQHYVSGERTRTEHLLADLDRATSSSGAAETTAP